MNSAVCISRNILRFSKLNRSFIPLAGSVLQKRFSSGLLGESTNSLSKVLNEELDFELQQVSGDKSTVAPRYGNQDSSDLPKDLKSMLEKTGFSIVKSQVGEQEVELSRKIGDLNVKVSFSIIPNYGAGSMDSDSEMDEDEEPNVDQPGAANSISGSDNDADDMSDEFAAYENEEPSQVLDLTVDITKTGSVGGTLTYFAQLDYADAELYIDQVEFINSEASKNLLNSENSSGAQMEFNRKQKYLAPTFGDLDELLQDRLSRYLEAALQSTIASSDEDTSYRALSEFVLEYAEWKEQREYVRWLDEVKGFVDA